VRDRRRLRLCDYSENTNHVTRDPTREFNICMASASSSSDPESAPCRRTSDAQRRARLDELAEAKCQVDEELSILHKELGMDLEPRDRQVAQDVPVQE
jgi:hypothetical protein